MAAIASENLAGRLTGSAAVLTLILFIFIPWEAGAFAAGEAGFSNAGHAGKLHGDFREHEHAGAYRSRKSQRRQRLGRGTALIAPRAGLTMDVQVAGTKVGFRACAKWRIPE